MQEPQEPEVYFERGHDALRSILDALDGAVPTRILDLPCGHGRVLRWLRAQWPQAEITACDLNRDGVDFCASEFGAEPLYSDTEPERIALQGSYDLIWCGSLLTHVDAPMWRRFLALFAEHLDGLLVFTTAGRQVAELMREGELSDNCDAEALLRSYDATGFGYADYHPRYRLPPDYGLARATPEWVRSFLAPMPFELVSFVERGWFDRQDVWVLRR
jgi:SAM-dependent methyltransferase